MNPSGPLRLPSTDRLLSRFNEVRLPHRVKAECIRKVLSEHRKTHSVPEWDHLVEAVKGKMAEITDSRIQPVINATGVVLHTNMGRSPLNPEWLDQLKGAVLGYSNLELDIQSGKRGKRGMYVESLCAELCSAEDALVVNNCAAALVLILKGLTTKKKEVVLSRGELVQIGGGFRIPDILESSGAVLKETGTTNRTELADYQKAIGPDTAMILKVHQSNFLMKGFVASVALRDLTRLARGLKIPVVEDLGSGALVDISRQTTLDREPTPLDSIKSGVDLVCFSGDKLLGGPQAGIVVGKRKWIQRLKKEPLFRALRCDKVTLCLLQSALESYLDMNPWGSVVVLKLLDLKTDALIARAEKIILQVRDSPGLELRQGASLCRVGGGSLPGSELESVTLDVRSSGLSCNQVAERLRSHHPPILAVVQQGWVRMHLRTVLEDQDIILVSALKSLAKVDCE